MDIGREIFFCSFEPPAVVVMVNHQFAHAAVNNDVFAGNKPSATIVTQEHHHLGDIFRRTYAPRRMLRFIRLAVLHWFISAVVCGGFYPAGADGIYPRMSRQAHAHGMGQREDTAFGRRVTFCVSLRLQRPCGRDVDDGRAVGKQPVLAYHADQMKWRGHADSLNVLKVFPGAVAYSDLPP